MKLISGFLIQAGVKISHLFDEDSNGWQHEQAWFG